MPKMNENLRKKTKVLNFCASLVTKCYCSGPKNTLGYQKGEDTRFP